MAPYDTNLASEFYVLSVLHRLGLQASLTLGNKKSVDIIVIKSTGQTITLDVKGKVDKTGWFIHNISAKPDHFIVFLTFLNQIVNPNVLPEVYIVPSFDVHSLLNPDARGTPVVRLRALKAVSSAYRDAWHLITS